MVIGQGIGFFKVLGTFGVIIMLIVWLGPTAVGAGKAIKTGEWNEMLKVSGGRLFAIDAALNEETNYLLDESNEDQSYTQIFHLAHALTLVFMLFFIAFLLFRFGSWLIGIRALSPSSDILIIIGVILVFLLIEFFYAWRVLGVIIIPLKDGLLYFLVNIPKILNGMIS